MDSEGTPEVEPHRRRKCGSDMADIISTVSYKYSSQVCVFNQTEALSEVQFDGSKDSLQAGLANGCAVNKLRAYGIQRTISFVVNAIPELYECQELGKIDQVLILHNNNLLIRITNKAADVDKQIIQVEIRNILQEIEKQDSKVHTKLVTEKVKAEFIDWVSASVGYVKEKLNNPVAVALAVGAALGVVSYFTFH